MPTPETATRGASNDFCDSGKIFAQKKYFKSRKKNWMLYLTLLTKIQNTNNRVPLDGNRHQDRS
ncbi:hypothetical protein SD70_11835 [Gordoniibacillus kamchatkensis]|uniref:Uncharacterized protein n=1 Tax=Gordoniibacillus kamchatkensis TaxID=1590651 RepID=A0ABR5AIV7_9BACL|nr:hypothetical protein SD70_11835 [Paenibacillus sp. VKM B-2647]